MSKQIKCVFCAEVVTLNRISSAHLSHVMCPLCGRYGLTDSFLEAYQSHEEMVTQWAGENAVSIRHEIHKKMEEGIMLLLEPDMIGVQYGDPGTSRTTS